MIEIISLVLDALMFLIFVYFYVVAGRMREKSKAERAAYERLVKEAQGNHRHFKADLSSIKREIHEVKARLP